MTATFTILVIAVGIGFYTSFMGGANDFANSFGTSIGSKAITFRTAIIIAACTNLTGAVFVGGHVTSTIAKGIVDPTLFGNVPEELAFGMLASLLAAGIFLQVATTFGLPVSTTHSIVGAVAGFGIAARGFDSIEWLTIAKIAMSWIISPVGGGVLAYCLFRLLTRWIFNAPDPKRAAQRALPILSGVVSGIVLLSIVYKGLKNWHLEVPLGLAILYAGVLGVVVAIVSRGYFSRVVAKDGKDVFDSVEHGFRGLQILTAGYVAFAHGANDVANGIAPLAAIACIYKHGSVMADATIPVWVLALGGVGIVCGLAAFGHRVIRTIGERITPITPSRGFVAEFSAATTVLTFSLCKMPVSTTHTLVGSVIGIGLARGLATLDLRVVKNIFASWIITLPATIILSAVLYKIFDWLFF